MAAPREQSSRTDAYTPPFASIVLLAVAACALVSLLPSVHVLIPLKLAAATFGALVLPGAVILRLLGWPESPAAALPGCAAWSVVALAPGLILALVSDGGLVVTVLWLLLVVAAGLLLGRGKPVEMGIRVSSGVLWFAGAVALFSALLWVGSWHNVGDAIEHIARLRKISELDPPRSLDELGLLPPGTGLHPGYAFPLWHATGALVVWISGLEEAFVFRYWPSVLIVFVAAAVYRAGRAMFGCAAAGAATCLAYLGVFAFPFGAVGFFSQLSYPGYISIFLFWPLVVERTFAYVRDGGREPVLTAAAASFAVSAIHPSYTPFMVMLLGAFLVARTVIVRDRGEFQRLATMVGAVAVPFLLFLVWLYPVADSAASTVGRASVHFETLLNRNGDLVSMKTEWVTRGGPAAVAALLLVPLAAAATRTRAAAFVAGTSALVILTLVVPWFFTPFADVMSISQGRRYLFYLPWAFALTGGALVLARFRHLAVAGALVAGGLLYLAWPGEQSYALKEPGPGWVAWVAAAGALAVLAVGAVRRLDVRYGDWWAVPIVAALVLPLAVTGIRDMRVNKSEPSFGAELLAAVREHVGRGDVLMADTRTAYRLTARAPVYIAAARGGHGGDTVVNQHEERRKAVKRFFNPRTAPAQAQKIVRRLDVQWVLVDRDEPYPREFLAQFDPVYEDDRYVLYPVDPTATTRGDEPRTS